MPAPAPAAAATPPSSPPAEAVRKTVTVLFCDLVGSTAFAERVDPESAREAMGRYHAMARATVEAHGGTVAKFIGDGVMAIWGVPEVAEDDAQRAVECGSALQRGFEVIQRHVADRYSTEVGLRVGVNTGEVVIAADDADIVGDALNTAARLEAACTPGQVLVGEDTWRLTRSAVRYEVLDEVRVKGKAEPVATFQVAESTVEGDESATPFVGRTIELGTLTRAFDTAVGGRNVQLTTVIGSPGVGKTRLAAELVRAVGDRAVALALRCERAGTATFAPIRDLLLGLAHVEPDADPAAKLAALEALFGPAVRDRERLVDLLGSFIGASEACSTEESFFAVRRVLEVLGARQPVVVVVDDIQWAEPLLLDLLEHLAEWVSGGAVLIVGLARPEIRTIRPSLAEGGRRLAAVVALEGLDAAATHELAARLLGVDELPADLVARLPESTEGNPLFVRELVRMLADDWVIVRDGDRYALTIDADAVEVPPTIQSLLAARVERLPVQERRLVELASVVGSEFPLGALTALAPDLDPDTVGALVEQLRRKELVDPTGTYWGNEALLRFHHVLIRDAAYRRLLKGARADLHLPVAGWIEQRLARDAGDQDVTTAFHLEQVHRYRSELGPVDDETRDIGARAAVLLRRAAERALDQDDLAAAGSLARRALDRLDPDHRSRPELLVLACEAFLSSGDIAKGRESLDELTSTSDGARLGAWVACFEAQLTIFTEPDQLSRAADAAERAAVVLAELSDDAGVAKARQVLAGALARMGRIGDSELELDRALTAARAADDRRRVTAVLGSAPPAALWGPSPVPRAGGRCLDVVRLLRITAGSPAVEAVSVRCQGVLEALRGRFDAARDLLEASRATAEELGLRHGLLETELYAGIVELMAGDAEAAEPHLRAAHAGLGTMGIGADAGQAAAYLGRSLLLQGRAEEAEPLAREAIATAGQNLQTAIAAHSVLAEIRAGRGQHDEARAEAESAVATAAGTDIVVDHANAVAALARVLEVAGDSSAAGAARREAARLFEAKGAVGLQHDHVAGTSAVEPVPADPASARLADLYRVQSEAMAAAFRDRDVDAVMVLMSPDVALVDHRSDGPWQTAGHAGIREIIEALLAEEEPTAYQSQLIDARGRRALTRTRFERAQGYSIDFLVVTDHDDDGRYLSIDAFGVDDVGAAISEMDRLDDRADANTASHVFRVFSASIALGDLGAMGAVLAPTCHREDRRAAVPLPTAGREDLTATMRALLDVGGAPGPLLLTRRCYGENVALMQGHWSYPDGGISPMLVAVRVRGDGLIDRMVVFDEGDQDAADAEARQLSGTDDHRRSLESDGSRSAARHVESQLSANSARRAIARVTGVTPGDTEGLLAVLAPGYVRIDRRASMPFPTTHNREEFVAALSEAHGLGFADLQTETVAIRGDRCTLVSVAFRTANDQEREFLMVGTCDESGLADRSVYYDLDALAEAHAELDRVFLEGEGRGHLDSLGPLFDFFAATNVADLTTAFRFLHEDFVMEDHRPARLGVFAAAEFRTLTTDLYDVYGEGLINVFPEVHEIGEQAVVLAHDRYRAGDRLGAPTWRMYTVWTARAGRLERCDIYGDDAFDEALARWQRLEGRHGTGELANRCSEAFVEMAERARAQDFDNMAQLFAEDHMRVDRREVVSAPALHGPEAQVKATRASLSTGMELSVPTPVATRGERTALLSIAFVTPDGTSVPMLDVVRVNDEGLIDYIAFHDPDALAETHAELDRAYLEGEGREHVAVLGPLFDYFRLGNAGDLDAMAEMRAISFAFEDHSRSGLGTYTADDYSNLIGELYGTHEAGLIHLAARIHAVGQHAAVVGHERYLADDQLGAPTWSSHLVFTVRDGKLERADQYDSDALPHALARFREIEDQGGLAAKRLTNRALEVMDEVLEQMSPDDLSVFEARYADDFVGLDRRSGVSAPPADRQAQAAAMQAVYDVEMDLLPMTPIAVRGQHSALWHGGFVGADGSEIPFLMVAQIDSQDRVASSHYFDVDDLAGAVAELDRQYLEGEGAEHADTVGPVLAYSTAYNAGDLDSIRHFYDREDYAGFDHTPAGFGPRTHADVMRRIESLSEVEPGARHLVREIHRLHGDCALVTVEQYRPDDALGSPSWRWVLVVRIVAGRAASIDLYPEDQQQDAMLRFEQLAGVTGELRNACVAVFEEFRRRVGPDDLVVFEELFTEDYRRIDRRRGVSAPTADRYEQAVATGALFDAGLAFGDYTPIAVRGDGLCLYRGGFHSVAGGEVPMLLTLSIDKSHRIDRMNFFDLEDLPLALDQLDQWWSEGLSAGQMLTARVARQAIEAVVAIDTERLETLVTDDLIVEDHRPLGFGRRDRSLFLASVAQRAGAQGVGSAAITRFHALTDGVGVATYFQTSHTAMTGSENTEEAIFTYRLVGQHIAEGNIYPVERLDQALAKGEELGTQLKFGRQSPDSGPA